MIINRDLLKIKVFNEKPDNNYVKELKGNLKKTENFDDKEIDYFVFQGKLKNQAYNKKAEPILILKKDKSLVDVIQAADQLQLKALSKTVTKYYICYPKQKLDV